MRKKNRFENINHDCEEFKRITIKKYVCRTVTENAVDVKNENERDNIIIENNFVFEIDMNLRLIINIKRKMNNQMREKLEREREREERRSTRMNTSQIDKFSGRVPVVFLLTVVDFGHRHAFA